MPENVYSIEVMSRVEKPPDHLKYTQSTSRILRIHVEIIGPIVSVIQLTFNKLIDLTGFLMIIRMGHTISP